MLCARLFLGLSKDQFESELKERLALGGQGLDALMLIVKPTFMF